ncbi:MAG: sn-glycerol-1-phosphate dehydrogenase [Lachnospiraceae bacterium]|nr:sn-glycerol-1-phosphate dehydrogenase [Lachnospiraceae bacterium]
MQELTRTLSLSDCLNHTFSCSCGHTHRAELEAVYIGKGTLKELPKWLEKKGYIKAYIICDPITKEIAGDQTKKELEEKGIDVQMHVITHQAYDEATMGEIVIHKDHTRNVVIGVGTGSINDMCRYFSYQLNLPYCIVATAAPMDGFASGISALTVDNLKTTFNAQPPQLIIGDTEILKGAPYSMISAGLGDLIGKFTCLCDWKLSKLIQDEYYCEVIVDMVGDCAKGVLKNADSVKTRDPKVLGNIMEGLVFTGVAMSMVGNSRPASGCEHHISHYWETIFEQQGRRPAPHGHQVGVGTILILKLTESLRNLSTIDFDSARKAAEAYEFDAWCQEIRDAYGPAAEGVIEMERKAKKNETSGRLQRIGAMEKHWKEICDLLEELPSSQTVIDLMKELQAPYHPSQIGVDKELLKNTLMYCKEIRARYTILQMLWDLNLLEQLTDQLIQDF